MPQPFIVSSAEEAEGYPTRSTSAVATLLVELRATIDSLESTRQLHAEHPNERQAKKDLSLDELEARRASLIHRL